LTSQLNNTKKSWLLLPVFGIAIFVLLYITATLLYPGGSQVDKNADGFSWINNYWCNLINETAMNGQHNPAKPYALTAMFVLCVSLSFFWFYFPMQISFGKLSRLIIQVSGTIAMAIAFLLFTDFNHDLVINLASIFGLIATTGTFFGLYKSKWYGLFLFGLLNLLLIGVNNYVYYTKELIIYLPVIQKISFASFLIWICSIDVHLYRKSI